MILNRLAEDLGELAIVEQRPQQDGRNMTMMLGPGKEPEPGDGNGASAAPADTKAPETEKPARKQPQQRPAGSANPVEVSPDQI
jgi:translation initiation factor IF-3